MSSGRTPIGRSLAVVFALLFGVDPGQLLALLGDGGGAADTAPYARNDGHLAV